MADRFTGEILNTCYNTTDLVHSLKGQINLAGVIPADSVRIYLIEQGSRQYEFRSSSMAGVICLYNQKSANGVQDYEITYTQKDCSNPPYLLLAINGKEVARMNSVCTTC